MKSLIKLTGILALLCLLPGNAFAFSGSISDSDGNGLPGARITLIAGAEVHVAYSGTNGSYSLPDLSPDTDYQIRVTLHGYPAQISNGNSNLYDGVDFEFSPADATLEGVVMQPDGTPVSAAIVDAGALGVVVTNLDGEFSITAPVGTQYTLRANALDMYFPAATTGVLTGNTKRIIVGDFD